MLISVGIAIACPFLGATPQPCVTDTLTKYINLGAQGCSIGNTVYANFSYSTPISTTTGVTPDQIKVTPVLQVPLTSGFTFSARWHAAGGQSQQSTINYTAVAPTNTPQQWLLTLDLGQAQVLGIIGSARVDQTTNVGNLSVFLQCADVCRIQNHDQVQFDSVSVILVSNHVTITGGNQGASLSGFTALLNLCPPCDMPQP